MSKYKRILLKLSGESLAGSDNYGIDSVRLNEYVTQIVELAGFGVQIAIVIGGGNIFRGLKGTAKGIDRVRGDYMGMIATVINGLALESAFETLGASAKMFTSFVMKPVGEHYTKNAVIETLRAKTIAILTCGTGNPYFTTDTAAALRAIETEADVLLKGTRVDGIYNKDPEKHADAVKYANLTFDEAYKLGLQIMDLTAFTLCKENNMPVIVFDMNKPGNLKKIINGENIGTLVTN